MTRWTHALRRPGPHPDRCTANVTSPHEDDVSFGLDVRLCGCDVAVLASPMIPSIEVRPGVRVWDPDRESAANCSACGHELVPAVSGRPSDSPEPPR